MRCYNTGVIRHRIAVQGLDEATAESRVDVWRLEQSRGRPLIEKILLYVEIRFEVIASALQLIRHEYDALAAKRRLLRVHASARACTLTSVQ